MNKSKNTIFVSVLGILTLIVATTGVTFAWFTTSMSGGTTANISATTATIGKVSYVADTISGSAILPGWSSGNKSVKVTLSKSDYPVSYACTLNITANGITDLKLTTSGTNSVTHNGTSVTTGSYKIASGTLSASSTSTSITTNYSLSFPETGKDQNSQAGKSVAGTVSCSIQDNKIYYNSSNTGGSATAPTTN